jgi:hypothetical protein
MLGVKPFANILLFTMEYVISGVNGVISKQAIMLLIANFVSYNLFPKSSEQEAQRSNQHSKQF